MPVKSSLIEFNNQEEAKRFEQCIVDCSISADGKQGIILLPGAKEIMAEVAS
jgi:hypothetical protein